MVQTRCILLKFFVLRLVLCVLYSGETGVILGMLNSSAECNGIKGSSSTRKYSLGNRTYGTSELCSSANGTVCDDMSSAVPGATNEQCAAARCHAVSGEYRTVPYFRIMPGINLTDIYLWSYL